MNSAYFSQFQSNPFIQCGSTDLGHYSRVRPPTVARSHRYHPYNDEHIFNSKFANPVSNTIPQYQQALAKYARQETTANQNVQNQVALAQSHFSHRQPQSQSQSLVSTHPSQASLQSKSSAYSLLEAERTKISTQSFSSSRASATPYTKNGVTLAAPIPKIFAARSEAVLNSLVATENQPVLAQGPSALPIAQQIKLKFIEERPSQLQSKVDCPSVQCTKYQLDEKENVSYPLSDQEVHDSRSSSHIQDRSTLSELGRTVITDACSIGSLDSSTGSSSLKKADTTQGPLRSISPASMIVLTEPILMSWCFDDAAVRRLAKAAGYE
ncbi:hypothetical protein J3R30DRAFT_872124 [Lentinula aciculospora]|uniref:Uncharacterized protein n=1 Tax=Lentinula aciculospora TaxID=153920 RepID=A0A9W9AQ02_9AGAR|nr:hypothetical protein J3R30DRAFT_872124 [Lentinula aciculospora]